MERVKMAGIPRSTYYHWVKQMNRTDKYSEEKQASNKYLMNIRVVMAIDASPWNYEKKVLD